jgi:hypothetical protein
MPMKPGWERNFEVAIDEATLWGAEVDSDQRIALLTLEVLTLPASGLPPDDRRVSILLYPVGRVAASLRFGDWDDPRTEVVPFELEELLEKVQIFKGLPIYGGDFIDKHEKQLARWGDRLSLDWSAGEGGRSHSIYLFQDGLERHLDLCIWFDELRVFDPEQNEIELDTFMAGGWRWWEAFISGDQRTRGYGIFRPDETTLATCPNCGNLIPTVAEEHERRELQCPICQQVFKNPEQRTG